MAMATSQTRSSHGWRKRIAVMVALLGLLLAIPGHTQTGTVAPLPLFHAWTNAGAICASCKVCTYAAGTSTALATYTDSTLATPNANPVVLDSSGRAAIFLAPRSYKFELRSSAATNCSTGSVLWTADNISATPPFFVDLDVRGTAGEALALGDVVYISSSDGRWYRADADAPSTSVNAGMVAMVPAAISSGATGSFRLQGRITGLAGLSIGSLYYVSGTAGALTSTAPANARGIGVADSTSTMVLAPNGGMPAGNFTVGGLFTANGSGQHSFGLTAQNGSNDVLVANTSTGTAARTRLLLGNLNDSLAGIVSTLGANFTTAAPAVQDGMLVQSTRPGGLSLAATSVSGTVRFYSGGSTERAAFGTDGLLTLNAAMKLTPQASAPSSPASGTIYVDSTASPDELCFYDGAGWQGISSGTDGNCS